jgi:hypothetical protein
MNTFLDDLIRTCFHAFGFAVRDFAIGAFLPLAYLNQLLVMNLCSCIFFHYYFLSAFQKGIFAFIILLCFSKIEFDDCLIFVA